MLRRLTFLTPASTSQQRQTRFPAGDDAIEPFSAADASAVRATLGMIGAALAGPEHRVSQTARALGLAADAHAELSAWSHGSWAGRLIDEVAASDPEAFAAWRVDPTASAPGGESLAALLARSARWLDGCATERRAVVLVDSSVVRAVVVHVLGAPPESFWRMDVAPLSTTTVTNNGSRWQVRSLGATASPAPDA